MRKAGLYLWLPLLTLAACTSSPHQLATLPDADPVADLLPAPPSDGGSVDQLTHDQGPAVDEGPSQSPPPSLPPSPSQSPSPSPSSSPPSPGSTQPKPPSGALSIYVDGLLNGWSDWSWSTTNTDEATVALGQKALAVTFAASGSTGFKLVPPTDASENPIPIAAATYKTINLYLNPGSSSLTTLKNLQFSFENGSQPVDISSYATLKANSWTQVRIPVAAANSANAAWSNLELINVNGVTLYVDAVWLEPAAPTPPSSPSPSPSASPSPPPSTAPGSSVPTDPITFTKDAPFLINGVGASYYLYVPDAYDSTHQTPMTLFFFMHGCGGNAEGDDWNISPGGKQDWIGLSLGGRDGDCWDVNTDTALVLAALADVKTHFNIKPKGVVLGGYSSGGDLTYRVMFYHANLFAGMLAENTSPFRDTGSTEANSLAAASWKFNVVHLAHNQDETYPLAGVETETSEVIAAGFPLKLIKVDGGHYDAAGAIENGHAVPGTDADLQNILLPYLDAGWTAP